MIPSKLKPGDEIRIVAPARSLSILSKETIDHATKRLEAMGYRVTFGAHVTEKDEFMSSPIASRVDDLHDAFKDKNVKAILTVIGGFNSNQLLKYLDYDLIKKNPKILCGFSDITALANAIYAKTGLVTYSGPHYSTFGMEKGNDYTEQFFKKCLTNDAQFKVTPSTEWSDDHWYEDQEHRNFIKNEGWWILHEGRAEGTIIGANLCTFQLLHGTEFMPSLKNTILFLEDDELCDKYTALTFDRDLQSLIHQPGFEDVRGIVIGRFQKTSRMTKENIMKIISEKKELETLPIIANVDFGHTTPIITFPIGGTARISVAKRKATMDILKH